MIILSTNFVVCIFGNNGINNNKEIQLKNVVEKQTKNYSHYAQAWRISWSVQKTQQAVKTFQISKPESKQLFKLVRGRT